MKNEEVFYTGKGKATVIYENGKKKHVFAELRRRGSSQGT